MLNKVTDVDSAQLLLSGCRKALIDQIDHPGLLILSALSRLLRFDPSPESVESSMRNLRSGLRVLRDRGRGFEKITEDTALSIVKIARKRMKEWLPNISEVVLENIPSRAIAREVYDILPQKSQGILMTLMVRILSEFRMAFNEGLDQWKRKAAS